MDLWKEKLVDTRVYKVQFRMVGKMSQQLYNSNDDYPAFTCLVEGWVRVTPEVLVVISTENVVDPNDQRVDMLLIPWSDVINIEAT